MSPASSVRESGISGPRREPPAAGPGVDVQVPQPDHVPPADPDAGVGGQRDVLVHLERHHGLAVPDLALGDPADVDAGKLHRVALEHPGGVAEHRLQLVGRSEEPQVGDAHPQQDRQHHGDQRERHDLAQRGRLEPEPHRDITTSQAWMSLPLVGREHLAQGPDRGHQVVAGCAASLSVPGQRGALAADDGRERRHLPAVAELRRRAAELEHVAIRAVDQVVQALRVRGEGLQDHVARVHHPVPVAAVQDQQVRQVVRHRDDRAPGPAGAPRARRARRTPGRPRSPRRPAR